MITLTPVGVGAAYARPGEVQSCYLVRTPTTAVCLDLGAGALNALQSVIAPQDLGAVVLSHRHPDHCADVLALHVYMYWGPGRGGQLRVLSPPGVQERLQAMASERGWNEALAFEMVHDGDGVQVGDVTLTFAEVPHIDQTLAVRVDHASGSVVYGADCSFNHQLARLATDADLLVAECGDGSTPNPQSPHLSAGEAGQIAADARVARLLLTHCFPEHDRDAALAVARQVFGATEWARQGHQYAVG